MSSETQSFSRSINSEDRPTSRTSTAAPGPTTSAAQQSNGDNSVNFYRNLFYILIGLLGVFAVISILSLLRARHRRRLIHAEALRLGVIVPGMPGYISLRERRSARRDRSGRATANLTHRPDWWEVGATGWMKSWVRPSAPSRGYSGIGNGGHIGSSVNFAFMATLSKSPYFDDGPESYLDLTSEKQGHFRPLAIIPPQPTDIADIPLPVSTLKYFPVNSAYRPEDLLPPPLVWGGEGMSAAQIQKQVDELGGKRVDVVTMIRMPESPEQVELRERAAKRVGVEEEEDGEEVLREWGGVCLGVIRMGVGSGAEEVLRTDGIHASRDGHGREL